MRLLPLIAVLVGVLAVAGCAKKPTTAPEAGDGTTVPAEGGASTSGAAGGSVGEATPLPGEGMGAGGGAGEGMVGADSVIYFDFDSSEIRPEYASVVAAQAQRLASNPAQRVRLEGHTDERGSREYNIALGERRAQAVRRALMLQGVADAQVVTVSYGEERPAVEGTDEGAWSKNRRVEFRPAG
jgi:peptidoglycan-associated lipoprotein